MSNILRAGIAVVGVGGSLLLVAISGSTIIQTGNAVVAAVVAYWLGSKNQGG